MKKRALYPGSFDPFTRGHDHIVRRALALMDEIIIAIGANSAKHSYFSPEARREMIARLYASEPRIRVVTYDCLTIDLGRKYEAPFLLRGVRNAADFEYEQQLAAANKELSGMETLLLFSDPKLSCVSSSIVRELLRYGRDVSPFIPEGLDLQADAPTADPTP